MKFKAYPIQIWFLDEDLEKSATFLNDYFLSKTISGCMQALVSAYFYFLGIRNKKFYKYYFSKEHRDETMDKLFPLWPFDKPPLFQQYTSRASKWCRQCNEHFQYIKKYLEICCNEYEYRFNKQHSASKIIEWIDFDARKISIPYSNINKITLEWKSLNPKWRKKDIVLGYRLQYKSIVQNNQIKMTDFSRRDIPDWLMEKENKWI